MPRYDRVGAWFPGFEQSSTAGGLGPVLIPNPKTYSMFWYSLIDDTVDEVPWEDPDGTVQGIERSHSVQILVDIAGGIRDIIVGSGLDLEPGKPGRRLVRVSGRELTANRAQAIVSAEVTIRYRP